MVPSLSELQVQFKTDYKTIQYTISGYLLGVAFVNFYCRATIGSFWKTSNNATIFFHFFDLFSGLLYFRGSLQLLVFQTTSQSSPLQLV